MDRLLYTALSGANVAQQQQQIHANNLANVNTEGFRADLASPSSKHYQHGRMKPVF